MRNEMGVNGKTRNKALPYVILWLLMLVPTIVKAQFSFDIPVVEAYINDHKQGHGGRLIGR